MKKALSQRAGIGLRSNSIHIPLPATGRRTVIKIVRRCETKH